MPYKVKEVLIGHDSDIRALYITENEELITSSRDASSIVWRRSEEKNEFHATQQLLGHENYVSACCAMPSSEKNPNGLILTGGHDNKICIYERDQNKHGRPIREFLAHRNAVSALSPITDEIFVSGSWDSSVKVWTINGSSLKTLENHTQAVFAVILLNSKNKLVSASADKTINVYDWPEYECRFTLRGHTDCVRGLSALNKTNFLSCSNDGTIRKWDALTGELMEIIYNHNSFLYSVASLEDSSLIVCGGENHSLIILDKEQGSSVIKTPALSIWAVGILHNRDIVTGCSDRAVRIYSISKNESDFAEEIESERSVKEVNMDSEIIVHGPEALTVPGKSDGEILLAKINGKTECYQWVAASQTWILVGDVLDSTPSSSTNGKPKKEVYEGKEYDYVFNIDVKDGAPPLKLPFNVGNNMYDVAEDFLIKHNLPMIYKTDIINFLLKNTASTSNAPSLRETNEKSVILKEESEEFVILSFIDFDKAKGKLMELAKIVEGDKNMEDSEKWINSIVELSKADVEPKEDALLLFRKCLEWSEEHVYPILDLMRVAVLNESANIKICDEKTFDFLSILKRFSTETTYVVNNTLIIKICANMCIHNPGQEFCMKNKHLIIDRCNLLASRKDKSPSLEIAISSWMLNYAILLSRRLEYESLQILIDTGLMILKTIDKPLGILRLLKALKVSSSSMKSIHVNESDLEFIINFEDFTGEDELPKNIRYTAKCLTELINIKLVKSTS